jgi:hypothetical protein
MSLVGVGDDKAWNFSGKPIYEVIQTRKKIMKQQEMEKKKIKR